MGTQTQTRSGVGGVGGACCAWDEKALSKRVLGSARAIDFQADGQKHWHSFGTRG